MTEQDRRAKARERGIALWLAGTSLAPGIVAGLKPRRSCFPGANLPFQRAVAIKRPRYRSMK